MYKSFFSSLTYICLDLGFIVIKRTEYNILYNNYIILLTEMATLNQSEKDSK
jgi:hypothetical protein